MNVNARMDKNGTVYIVDENEKIFTNLEEVTVTTRRDKGVYKNTVTVTLSDIFGTIEPMKRTVTE